MEIMQLKYFYTLAQVQHMTKAAKELHIAQPALSRTLRNLESELNLQLFDRAGKHIYLNENGKALLRHVKIILQELEDAERELKELKGRTDRYVSLSLHAGSSLLPEMIGGFKNKHPEIVLQIIQQDSPGTTREKCDISIYSSIEPAGSENSTVLMEEEIRIAMPLSNPLSASDSIRLTDTANEPFICLFKGAGLRVVTDEYCKMAGFSPNIVLESDSPATVRELISLGVGLSFIPMISWPNVAKDPSVKLVKITEPYCKRYVNMRWRASCYVPKASILLREYLIDFFENVSRQYELKEEE